MRNQKYVCLTTHGMEPPQERRTHHENALALRATSNKMFNVSSGSAGDNSPKLPAGCGTER